MGLTEQQVHKIQADFRSGDVAAVEAEFDRLSTAHTMDSEYNRNNAISAILELSKGDLDEVKSLVDADRLDFRDVIYWWMLENKKATHPE